MKLRITVSLGITLGILPLHAQLRPGHQYTLTAAQVTPTLTRSFAARGIEISEAQVTLPASVVVSEPDPALEVRSVEPLGRLASDRSDEVSSAVKLVCRQPHTCVPFYAIVSLPLAMMQSSAPTTSSSLQAAKIALKQTPVEYTIRSGAHATLLLDDGASHISLEVITLENGAAGHTIRVSSTDHKHTYKAEVVSAGLLRGSF